MSRRLNGSCQVPLGGFAELHAGVLSLRGFVALPDGRQLIRAAASGAPEQPEALGAQVAQALLQQGAAEIISALDQ